MADSDDDYDRRKGRDKFRRERSDYERRDDRRRESWEDRRGMRGNQSFPSVSSRQNVRSREIWNNSRNTRDRREMYGREQYESRRRDRFSPPRHEMGHQVKRMRRDWDDSYQQYDMPYGGGRGGGPGHMPMGGNGGPGHHPGWGHGAAHDMGGGMPPRQEFAMTGGPNRNELDFPTQPPLLTFKQYLTQQDDAISEEDAIKRYNEYKIDFRRQQISEFFLTHKEEEWFKSKYHPEEHARRQEEVRASLRNRVKVFLELQNTGRFNNVSVDVDKTDDILKVLDAAVIKMEGGSDFDLTVLDEPPDKEEGAMRNSISESQAVEKSPEKEKKDETEKKDADKETDKPTDKPMELNITPEQEELQRKAREYQEEQEKSGEQKRGNKRKKNKREKSEYSYESESESDSGSDSDMEPVPPGLEDEPLPPGTETAAAAKSSATASSTGGAEREAGRTSGDKGDVSRKEGKRREMEEEKDVNTRPEDDHDTNKPRPLHRTNSIFLRNLAPTITKMEVEAMCRRYPGFMRVALQDPQPERRFFRRGWVTFAKSVNIKDICWNLNNIRLRDCELGATLNRELKQRVRPVNGLTVHKAVARNDIKLAARIIQNLDRKWGLWADEEEEKKDEEKEHRMSFSFVSNNPVLLNITDYLVEEGSFEEDELLGNTGEEKDSSSDLTVERDDNMLRVLDRMIFYLRIVHSIDYYSANEYPNEDEMPHRCGIMHARGMAPGPTSKLTQSDVAEWITSMENKLKPFLEVSSKITEEEAMKLGMKNPESEVEKFVIANTQELAKDKWLCPLSGKKFKGPDFVRKHIFNKHAEKVEEVKKEVAFFNNYLMDPKRPSLPEHPSNRSSGQSHGNQFGGGGGSGMMPTVPSQPPPMMGFNQRTPPLMYGGNMPPYGGPAFGGRDNRDFGRIATGGGRPFGRRSDPRPVIEYRDLDAPEDMDIF